MLPSRHRLKKNYQFDYIYRKGRKISGKNLMLVFTEIRGAALKIGFSVSNKVGKAVVRNRVRRRLRESVRAYLPRLRRGYHCVFTARPEITEKDFAGISEEIGFLFRKAELLI